MFNFRAFYSELGLGPFALEASTLPLGYQGGGWTIMLGICT